MRVKELCTELGWDFACGDGEREISGGIYCCDLLSIVMGRAPAGSLWITVMGNVNSMAVATLADTACVVIAERMPLDPEALEGAKKGGITVLKTEQPVFEAALSAAKAMKLIRTYD
ncbi:MAG: hypothetical protein VB064_10800 [Oscillospiraceae bacterium]|nr:hypothetical protein [Oscillospiraceae bacterium]